MHGALRLSQPFGTEPLDSTAGCDRWHTAVYLRFGRRGVAEWITYYPDDLQIRGTGASVSGLIWKVTDADGTTFTDDFSIVTVSTLSIGNIASTFSLPENSAPSDGTLTLPAASGGVPPYSYTFIGSTELYTDTDGHRLYHNVSKWHDCEYSLRMKPRYHKRVSRFHSLPRGVPETMLDKQLKQHGLSLRTNTEVRRIEMAIATTSTPDSAYITSAFNSGDEGIVTITLDVPLATPLGLHHVSVFDFALSRLRLGPVDTGVFLSQESPTVYKIRLYLLFPSDKGFFGY